MVNFMFKNGFSLPVLADLLSDGLVFLLILALIIWLFFKNKAKLPDFLVAIFVSGFLSEVIKDFVNRPRPVSVYTYEGSGFPSTHTTLAFIAFFFFLNVCHRFAHIGKRSQRIAFDSSRLVLSTLLLIGSIMVGLLRIIAEAHFISDVIGGAALAFLVSVVFMYYDVSVRRIK